MTTQEKASELVGDFRSKILLQHSAYCVMTENSFPMPLNFAHKAAIQCALMAVDEIIKAGPYYFYPGRKVMRVEDHSTIEYWQEVKSEIEKL